MPNPTAAKPGDIQELVRRRLTEHRVRYTGARRAVVRRLQEVDGPCSAAELHEALRSVPLSSLYRSLTVLDEAGVVHRQHDTEGVARFELAEWLGGHHHHVVCIECGTVQDVELSRDDESLLHRLAGSVARTADFRLDGHALEVKGVCAPCRR